MKDDEKSISLAESLIPSEIQSRLKKFSSYYTIADGRNKEQVDAYLMYCRSEEEQSLLLSEATHVVTYYKNRKRVILKELDVTLVSDSNAYTRGMHALFKQMLDNVCLHLNNSKRTLEIMNKHDLL